MDHLRPRRIYVSIFYSCFFFFFLPCQYLFFTLFVHRGITHIKKYDAYTTFYVITEPLKFRFNLKMKFNNTTFEKKNNNENMV